MPHPHPCSKESLSIKVLSNLLASFLAKKPHETCHHCQCEVQPPWTGTQGPLSIGLYRPLWPPGPTCFTKSPTSNHTQLNVPIMGWSRAWRIGWLSGWLWVRRDTHMPTPVPMHMYTDADTVLCRSPTPSCMVFYQIMHTHKRAMKFEPRKN